MRREDPRFGLARAGRSREALLFLDVGMLPEAGWLAARALAPCDAGRGAPGFRLHVPVDGVDAEMIRGRAGTLRELFKGRKVDPTERWIASHLFGTGDLTSRADDLVSVMIGANFGVRREFHELAGGFDESFTQWGGEDTELGNRVFARGALLVPLRGAVALAPGFLAERMPGEGTQPGAAAGELANLISHPWFRTGTPGWIFTVPQYVVTIEGGGGGGGGVGGNLPAECLPEAVERVLADPVHDLVVRLALPAGDAR